MSSLLATMPDGPQLTHKGIIARGDAERFALPHRSHRPGLEKGANTYIYIKGSRILQKRRGSKKTKKESPQEPLQKDGKV